MITREEFVRNKIVKFVKNNYFIFIAIFCLILFCYLVKIGYDSIELRGEIIDKKEYYEAPIQLKTEDLIIPIQSSQRYKIIYKCDTIISSVSVNENIYYLAEKGDSIFQKDGIISLKKK